MTVVGWPVAVRTFPHLALATPRLYVRPVGADDAQQVTQIFADTRTRRWLPLPARYGPIDGEAWCTDLAAERRDSGEGDHYGVVRREDGQLVACVWLKRTDWVARATEVSFAVAAPARGFGFAAEAVDGLAVALLCEHRFERLELRLASGNVACRRVAEKAGFTYEGVLRNAGYVHTGRVDVEVWSLVSADLRG